MKTHGMSKTRVYWVWDQMRRRCMDPKHKDFHLYGGRGIAVDPSWMKFEGFYADMGEPNGLMLERKKNELGYSKANCEWATALVQANNQRSNRKLTCQGRTLNVSQWADYLGINRYTLYERLDSGWSAERALSTPARALKRSAA